MRLAIGARSRDRLGHYLFAIGLIGAQPLPTWATPVDKLLPPNIELIPPTTEEQSPKSHEVSVLEISTIESVAVGDIPSGSGQSVLKSEPLRLAASQTSELLQQRFDNGKIRIERYVTEDADGNLINHGPYKEYDVAGTLIRSGNYEMGQLDGTWWQMISSEAVQGMTSKLDPGFRPPFKSEASFVQGELHGDWTVSDSKGNPVLVWQFEFGKRENLSTWFDSRHTTVLEIMYNAGIANGPAMQLVAGQREPNKVVYDQGRVVQPKTNWYEKGKKRSEEMWLAPATNVLVSHDWWNTKVLSEPLPTSESVRHGSFTAWHPNGQKSVEGQFRNGAPIGEFRWWYANGQPQSKGYYEAGEFDGEWMWWHANGMKMMEGSYEQGLQIGQWSQWNADGSLVRRDLASAFPLVKQELDLDHEPATDRTLKPMETRSPAARPASLRMPTRSTTQRPASANAPASALSPASARPSVSPAANTASPRSSR